jgi:hypothetical protein
MKKRREPDLLSCDQSQVVMGNSSSPKPSEWRTRARSCTSCNVAFTVTASEQRFWYEELHIPYHVAINRCPSCRGKQRALRRVLSRLSELIPAVGRGDANDEQQREAALVIAEGLVRRLPTIRQLDIPVLGSSAIVEKGARLISALRKRSKRHDDLIPVQILFHERLQHERRVERLRAEQRLLESGDARIRRALSAVTAWLKNHTKSLRDRITKPPRR